MARVPVRVVSIDAIAFGEHDENEIRKDFTPSERVAIGSAAEAAPGERRGRPASEKTRNCAELTGKETRDVATGAPELFAEMDGVAG